MKWSAELDPRPVKTPDGKKLATLADARAYMLKLKPAVAKQPLWQTAASELLKAAEHGGPFKFTAYCAMVRAVHGLPRTDGLSTPDRRKESWTAKRKKAATPRRK